MAKTVKDGERKARDKIAQVNREHAGEREREHDRQCAGKRRWKEGRD